MPVRCVSFALQSCVWSSRVLLQGKRSLQAHGRVSSPSSWLLSPTPVANHAAGRAFSTGSTPGEAAAAAAAASVDDAKKVAGGVFPWRNAPDQVVAPAGSGSPLDDIVESIFEEYCLKGVDFKAGAEAAFVTTAAAFFKMRPSEVRAPKTEVEAAAGAEGESTSSKSDAQEGGAAAEEKEEPTETREEEAERVLAAIDPGLVAFLSDKGGLPYYRLHRVVGQAITWKKFIFGVQRGDDVFGRISLSMSPSFDVVMQEKKAFAQIKNALAGNATVTLQVDVDLACDETFYVADKDTGEIIQGKRKSSRRIHRVRLESCILLKHTIEQPYTWKVIDLDDWLKGNAFC